MTSVASWGRRGRIEGHTRSPSSWQTRETVLLQAFDPRRSGRSNRPPRTSGYPLRPTCPSEYQAYEFA